MEDNVLQTYVYLKLPINLYSAVFLSGFGPHTVLVQIPLYSTVCLAGRGILEISTWRLCMRQSKGTVSRDWIFVDLYE